MTRLDAPDAGSQPKTTLPPLDTRAPRPRVARLRRSVVTAAVLCMRPETPLLLAPAIERPEPLPTPFAMPTTQAGRPTRSGTQVPAVRSTAHGRRMASASPMR